MGGLHELLNDKHLANVTLVSEDDIQARSILVSRHCGKYSTNRHWRKGSTGKLEKIIEGKEEN